MERGEDEGTWPGQRHQMHVRMRARSSAKEGRTVSYQRTILALCSGRAGKMASGPPSYAPSTCLPHAGRAARSTLAIPPSWTRLAQETRRTLLETRRTLLREGDTLLGSPGLC